MTFKEYIKPDIDRCEFLASSRSWLRVKFLHEHEYVIWKYQLLLRKEEYYFMRGNILLSTYYRIRKNILGQRLGFTIHKNVFGTGLRIWHYGNIVVNAQAKVGFGCTLHGDNCIGNKGKDNKCPTIGNNVEFGVGAKALGGITIANNVFIAAGAIVVNDITESNVVVAGIPAKIIKKII